jgi:Tol biopolymer transport system component
VGGGSGEIAFASSVTGLPQIWMMNADGTANHQVTDMPEGACQPTWSPDGSRLAFISPCAFNQEIYPGASLFIINVDGTGLVPLPSLPGGDFDPAWSPDGSQIAFTSLRDYNRAQVYVINLSDNSFLSLSGNTVRDAQPSWSSDGQQIAFISTRRGPFQVWTMSRDGSDPILFSRSGSLKNSHPVWSPDGRVIVFSQSEVLGGVPRLVAARFEAGNFTESKITNDATPMREASYSPDGFWLAFESWPDGTNHDIYLMTANGQGRQRLTSDPAFDFDPAWRPVPATP